MERQSRSGGKGRLVFRGRMVAALLSLTLAGCHAAMSTSTPGTSPRSPPDRPYTGTVADWPLFFVRHSFGAHCFDTYGCQVLYQRFPHGVEAEDDYSPSVESFGANYPEILSAGHLGIRNFPPPAIVTWRSKDGERHRAEIDIGEIFKDGLIRHNVPRGDIPEEIGIGDTEIILEVNDRKINVYTQTYVPTKQLQIPGNQYSGHRNDLILVFSQTY